MTSIESRSYCRVVVIAPSTRVDLALPADVPIIDLLPMLLQYAGEVRDDGGGAARRLEAGRAVGRRRAGRRPHAALARRRRRRGAAAGRARGTRRRPGVRRHRRRDRHRPPRPDQHPQRQSRASAPAVDRRRDGGRRRSPCSTAAHRRRRLHRRRRSRWRCSGSATAIAKGTGDRILATATAACGVPFTLVCGLNAVPGGFGRWGVLLGASLALVYALGAELALGTGTVVFAGAATTALLDRAAVRSSPA